MRAAKRGVLDRLETLAGGGAKAFAIAGLVLLLAYAFLTLCDGLSRALAGQPIDVVRDLGNLVVAVAVGACLPWSFLKKTNITITFVDSFVSRGVDRAMTLAAAIVTLVILLGFAWQFYVHAGNFARAGETTAMLNWPKAPFWYVVDAWMWWAVFVQGVIVTREIAIVLWLRGSEDGSESEQHGMHAEF